MGKLQHLPKYPGNEFIKRGTVFSRYSLRKKCVAEVRHPVVGAFP